MKLSSIFLFLFLVSFLSSCASTVKQKCETVNWELMGKKDAREGQNARINAVAGRCEDAGATANRDAYMRGYRVGIAAFCSNENGKFIGMKGEVYNRQCPIFLEPTFLRGYNEGKALHNELKTREATAEARDQRLQLSTPACSLNKCTSNGESCLFDSDCK